MRILKAKSSGFTIIELLVVIVVIAILATISIVAYNGLQDRARATKASADIASISRAIEAARGSTGKVLKDITGSTATANSCMSKPAGTDLAALNHTTDSCWTDYTQAMQLISTASGANLVNLVDPWGRPYAIDENEGAGSPCGNGQDNIGVYTRPLSAWAYMYTPKNMPYITPGC